nr:hypothetical protein [uncultured Campylobacter sp.]
MTINLEQIYAKLKAWRHERGITAESQKAGYLVNVMEELGELATALREYERFSKPSYPYPKNKKYAEHGIIDALCDISVFTINAGADIPCSEKLESINTTTETTRCNSSLSFLLSECGNFDYYGKLSSYVCFNQILLTCAKLCEIYGFDFQIAMDETIKEISSRTGAYDEVSKKWVKDESDEARAKWYQADYEKARIKQ